MSMPISCVSFFSAGLRRLVHPCTLADYIARALLRFKIYFPDVLAYDAEADKLYAADKADYARHARPARDGLARYRRDEPVIIRSGFTDRLVMPSTARAIIFFSG